MIEEKPLSYLTPKAAVRSSAIAGQGLFAIKPIKKDEIISVSGGRILSRKEYRRILKTRPEMKNFAMKIAPGFYLMPQRFQDVSEDDFVNHSCNPNAGLKGQIVFVALRNIAPGEEITYDYALTDDDPDNYFRCRCGSPSCRKIIRGSDWKKTELQKKYRGYFAWHIQRKIDA